MVLQPAPPLDRWTTQVVEPAFGFAWWLPGAVFVNQPHTTMARVADATFIHDLIDACLAACKDDVARAGGITILHDWRFVGGYDPAARPVFMGRMKQRPPGYLKSAIAVLRPQANPLFRMAIEGANLFAAVALQRSIRLGFDIDAAIDTLAIRPPGPGDRFPAAVPAYDPR